MDLRCLSICFSTGDRSSSVWTVSFKAVPETVSFRAMPGLSTKLTPMPLIAETLPEKGAEAVPSFQTKVSQVRVRDIATTTYPSLVARMEFCPESSTLRRGLE